MLTFPTVLERSAIPALVTRNCQFCVSFCDANKLATSAVVKGCVRSIAKTGPSILRDVLQLIELTAQYHGIDVNERRLLASGAS